MTYPIFRIDYFDEPEKEGGELERNGSIPFSYLTTLWEHKILSDSQYARLVIAMEVFNSDHLKDLFVSSNSFTEWAQKYSGNTELKNRPGCYKQLLETELIKALIVFQESELIDWGAGPEIDVRISSAL